MNKKKIIIPLSAIAAAIFLIFAVWGSFDEKEKISPDSQRLDEAESTIDEIRLDNPVSWKSGSESAVSNNRMYVTGVKENISLKETADGDTSPVLDKLSIGTEVELIDGSDDLYYYVEVNGIKGYIKKEYLTSDRNAVSERIDAYVVKKASLFDTNDNSQRVVSELGVNSGIYIVAKNSGEFWYVYAKDVKMFGYVKNTDISFQEISQSSSYSSAYIFERHPERDYDNYDSYDAYHVENVNNYLAIRHSKAYDASNEIGRLYSGDTVYVIDNSTGTYWYCYSPDLKIYGYVNSAYLSLDSSKKSTATNSVSTVSRGVSDKQYTTWTVEVVTCYLALRSDKAYDMTNEIGRLYNGEEVYVSSDSYESYSDEYWYVYSPNLNMWGYVNSNYIFGNSDYTIDPMIEQLDEGEYKAMRVTENDVKLRKAPCTGDNVIAALKADDEINLFNNSYAFKSDKFWYVEAAELGVKGYIESKYIYKP